MPAFEPLVHSNYVPHDGENFMSDTQRDFFRHKLVQWRLQLLKECQETISSMKSHDAAADEIDAACNEMNYRLELRTRDRERKLINKIDEALRRLEDGSYGYCEETGDPISLRRLIARPIATLSIEAQERHERRERSFREDNVVAA
jgi:DnaK suppressor protein